MKPTLTPEQAERWPDYAKYVEKAGDTTSAIGAFIEWLTETYTVMKWSTVTEEVDVRSIRDIMKDQPLRWKTIEREDYVAVVQSPEQWLCEYYGIDYRRAMQQKDECVREALETLRRLREEHDAGSE